MVALLQPAPEAGHLSVRQPSVPTLCTVFLSELLNQIHTCRSVSTMSALQVYKLFDDIMLLAEGHIVYFGPKDEVSL
jgi:hypothetical protein